jgi:hypothetical protein
MIGTLSMDAWLRPGLGKDAGFDALAPTEEVSGYLKTAGFGANAGQQLIRMLTTPKAGAMEEHIRAWNTVNGMLTDEAKRVSPAWGAKLHTFGMSLRFLQLSLTQCPPGGTAEEREARIKLARTVLVSPLGEDLFPTGHSLPLPQKMQTVLSAAEHTDTSTLEGCEEYAEHLHLLLKMTRAVAKHGPSSLERFPA